jgi:hypothetical protein
MKPNKVAQTLTLVAGIREVLCSNLGQDLKWHWADLSASTLFSLVILVQLLLHTHSFICNRRFLILAIDRVVK